jgi:hypothetical protein
LNRHGGPVEPVSARSDRAGLFTQVCQLQQCQTRRIFLTGHILLGRATSFSLLTGRRSVSCTFFLCRATFFCPVASPPPCQRASNFFGLSGQQLCMQKLFPLSGHFPSVWARRLIFFSLAAAQQVLRAPIFLSGHFHSLRARRIFYLVTLWSQLACKCQGAMQYPLCSNVHARTDFFCAVRSTAAAHAKKKFLSGHFSSTGRAQFFLDASAQPAHHAAAFFSLFSHFSMHACQGHQRYFFLSSRFVQLRAQFFLSHSTTACAAFLFL